MLTGPGSIVTLLKPRAGSVGDGGVASRSRNVEDGLELLDQSPLLHSDLSPVELLQGVDTGTRDVRVQLVSLLQLTTVHGLVGALNLDGNGGLALLADCDGLVVTLDGCPVGHVRDQ